MAKGINNVILSDLSERFQAKIRVDSDTGCWIWAGATKGNGYGNSWWKGRNMPAHRAVYLDAGGDIPNKLDIDHLCRNRLCVNPNHMEPVSRSENIRRGLIGEINTKRAQNQTLCKRGHEFTKSNTRHYNGRRHCRACARLHAANHRLRKESQNA